jgi:hypothetical protein
MKTQLFKAFVDHFLKQVKSTTVPVEDLVQVLSQIWELIMPSRLLPIERKNLLG